MLPGNPSTVVFCDPPPTAQGTPSAFSLAEPLFNQSMTLEVVPGWLGSGQGHPCRPLCSRSHGGSAHGVHESLEVLAWLGLGMTNW